MLSYPYPPCPPAVHYTDPGVDIHLDIVPIARGREHGDDLFNRGADMADERDRDLALDIAVEEQAVEMLKAICPALHLGIPSKRLVDAWPISNAPFIPWRHGFAGLAGRPHLTFV